VSTGIRMDTSNIPVTIKGSSAATSSSTSSVQGTTTVNVKGVRAGAASGSSSGSGNSSSAASPAVQALQREIAQLQKILAQEEQALRAANQRNKGSTDPASVAEISALQSVVTTTNGQLEAAVTALATALLAEGSSSGGSLVSASV